MFRPVYDLELNLKFVVLQVSLYLLTAFCDLKFKKEIKKAYMLLEQFVVILVMFKFPGESAESG